ncbi:MAG: ArnT family glycosyltransferase [Thermomicrobiales bacterium]
MIREAGTAFPRVRQMGLAGIGERLRAHWPVVLVLACFAGAAVVVPTLAPVATTDDWGYTRSVEILLDEGRLTILPAVAASAVFQVLWGALFGLIFGMDLGVMRLSTVVAAAIAALASYGLCRQLGVERGRSAIGAAAFLFNPLAFALAFSFMTDLHFVTWLTVATYFYAKGMGDDSDAHRALFVGSIFAAFAFLVRQQGALIPLAVGCYLVTRRRIGPSRAGLLALLRIGAIPALTVAGYYLWLRFVHGVPGVQESFTAEVSRHGLAGTYRLMRDLTVIELMYLGFFALPLVAAVIPGAWRAIRTISGPAALVFAGWLAVLAAGVTYLTMSGRRMPYVPQFLGRGGVGPPDVRGSRPHLFHQPFFDVAAAVCLVAAAVVGLLLCRALIRRGGTGSNKVWLVAAILIGQVAGVLPPSYHYLNRGGSLDRYLLPLLPLGIALTLWAVRDLRLVRPVAVTVIAGFALFSVAATRDYLTYMDAVWDVAREANDAGVAETQLDAGAAWVGYHLYTDGRDQGIEWPKSPAPRPWWLSFYGKPSDASYVVAGERIRGYQVVWERPYDSWLSREPTVLFLLRRDDVTGPPYLEETSESSAERSETRWTCGQWLANRDEAC